MNKDIPTGGFPPIIHNKNKKEFEQKIRKYTAITGPVISITDIIKQKNTIQTIPNL